jgi:hypothetical protein
MGVNAAMDYIPEREWIHTDVFKLYLVYKGFVDLLNPGFSYVVIVELHTSRGIENMSLHVNKHGDILSYPQDWIDYCNRLNAKVVKNVFNFHSKSWELVKQ